MSHYNNSDHRPVSLREALIECYLGSLFLFAYLAVKISYGSETMSGGLLLLAAVMAMMGFAKADMALIGRPRSWLKHHPTILSVLHKITNEGELAGIAIGAIAFGVTAGLGHLHSLPVYNCLSLLGILAAARLAIRDITPFLRFFEYVGGIRLVLVSGGFLAMFLGPAASVALVKYFSPRVHPDRRADFAVQLAAIIGSGNGMMPYVAAPVLIVWPLLQEKFHWTLLSFLGYIGLPCLIYVLAASTGAQKLLKKEAEPLSLKPFGFSRRVIPSLLLLSSLVTAHMVTSGNTILATIDVAVGTLNVFISRGRFPRNLKSAPDEIQEDCFKATWEPIILAGLLCALDIIGAEGAPFVVWAAGFIPLTWPILAISIVFFAVAAPSSGFADNALITKVFIAMVVPLIPSIGPGAANVLATSILLAALFGGTLTPPGNIPNFPIRAELKVKPTAWMKAATVIMLKTMPIYLIWIAVLSIL